MISVIDFLLITLSLESLNQVKYIDMEKLITGIHHVTAVSGDVQENIDFYTGFLGLRLVKTTVNFDDPEVYHFYFGDESGTGGTIMTTFPYGKKVKKGRTGQGKINVTAFSLPMDSLSFWLERLKEYQIDFKPIENRFKKEQFISLEDDDGLGIELVFTEKEERMGYSYSESVPEEHSIRGIHHVTMAVNQLEKTSDFLTSILNHQLIVQEGDLYRFAVEDQPGQYIDVRVAPNMERGLSGRGMVHHVAFLTPNTTTQGMIMKKVEAYGISTTEVRDRNYFSSIYFNEPSGIIFEIATAGPGFTIDEDILELGMTLKLPEPLEARRSELTQILPPFIYPH